MADDPVILPGGLKRRLEALRNRDGVAGVPEGKALKVVGHDPLPKGATYGPNAVTLSSGTLDGWDLRGRGLIVTGRASATNIVSHWEPTAIPLYPIDIRVGGDLEWAENLEFEGSFGKAEKPSAVINARSEGSGAGFSAGHLRMLRRSRFEGFPSDHMKILGVKGGTQVIEECYFGPQWAPQGSKAHADCFTTVAVLGKTVIRRCLIDWTKAGRSAGLTNIFRIVRNKNTDFPVRHLRIEENLCYYGPSKSYPVQVVRKGANFDGPIEFIGNFLQARVGDKGGISYFHPSSDGGVDVWRDNVDAFTGAPVAGPAGSR
jgi:hypothetical protein